MFLFDIVKVGQGLLNRNGEKRQLKGGLMTLPEKIC
jgi:hypothetical protein